jgi:hypothetical protein
VLSRPYEFMGLGLAAEGAWTLELATAAAVRCRAWFGPASVARLTTPSDQAADAHQHGTEQADPRLAL